MCFNQFIGTVMRLYRKSPLHSQKVGSFLAKILTVSLIFRRTNLTVKEIKGINYELDLREVIDSSLFFSGTFEELEEEVIESILKPGMITFDIGANFGYYTFKMASLVKPGGWVYAFEPTDWAYKKILRNSNLNPSLDNIRFLKLGLSDNDEKCKQLNFQSSYRTDGKEFSVTEEMTLVKLDTFAEENKLSNLDFIKIDVDGYEGKVVRGAVQTLLKFHPIIFFEISPSLMMKNNDQPSELVHQLVLMGYKFKSVKGFQINDLTAYCEKIKNNSSSMVLALPIE